MPWPKTGTTYYHAQLELTDKCQEIKGLAICNNWDVGSLVPAKRSVTTLLPTDPSGMNCLSCIKVKIISVNFTFRL